MINNLPLICLTVFIATFFLTVLFEIKLIPMLKNKAKQPIYEEGPSWHLNKTGTPTMGGLAFLLSISLSLTIAILYLLSNKKSSTAVSIMISLLFAIGNSLIGILDDITKLRRQKNGGLTPMQKLFLQALLAIIFLMARKHFFSDGESFSFFLGKIDLRYLYYPLSFITLLGIVNCTNLTDGVDGLCATVASAIGVVVLIAANSLDTKLVFSAVAAGTIGFLLFNVNPAKIFMGDTGSLFLGGIIATLGFSVGNPLIVIIFGIVYVIEGISVILQVLWFKLFRKRIFKMAPLHHHLEKSNIAENKICIIALAITLISSLIAITFI